jgi:hypothetical protein
MWDGVTEEYERHLWDELNALLADVAEGSEGDPEDAILFAMLGGNSEVRKVYLRLRKLARERPGHLRDQLEGGNPIATAQRRMQSGYRDSHRCGPRP